jgi:multiple sugar transport system permease protein
VDILRQHQAHRSLAKELEDAAKIDGCGPFATYWKVMLPQVKPALAAIAIMAVLAAWNNFQGPLIYLSSPEQMPMAYGLQLYQQDHAGEPGLMMAASTMVVLPIVVLFFFSQRYFIEGVSLSGLGGR